MRAVWLLILSLLGGTAIIETTDIEYVREVLEDIKKTIQNQNVIILDIQDKLNVVGNTTCSGNILVKDIENKIENKLLKKFLNVFSENPKSVDRNNSTKISLKENMKVEKKAELLLPKLETYLTTTTQKIEEIKTQLNQTRMVADGVWEEARKEVKATKDIFKQMSFLFQVYFCF